MILTKTPYRIALSGGGTDLGFYYKNIASKYEYAKVSIKLL